MGALIMVGTLAALIVLVWALVLRFDPEARGPRPGVTEGGADERADEQAGGR